ncbi:MAG: hypothetical protein IJU81_03720 [Bacteroidales bacterium]|nr:hypothetical protein [Bacteroidales bacterium]
MKLLSKIQEIQQQRVLKRLTSVKRSRRLTSMEQVKTIALIFTVGSERQWNVLDEYITRMERSGKQVFAVGYQAKDLQLDYIITHTKCTICHEKDDFNIWNIPKEEVILPFAKRKYDLMLDTTAERTFWSLYMSARIAAKIKVSHCQHDEDGRHKEIYDFEIKNVEAYRVSEFLSESAKCLDMMSGKGIVV